MKKKQNSIKIEIPTLSRQALIVDKKELSVQIKSTLNKIKDVIKNKK